MIFANFRITLIAVSSFWLHLFQVPDIFFVNAPGLMRFFRILVQVIAALAEQVNQFLHIGKIQVHAVSVQCHLSDIGAHVRNAKFLHFHPDSFLVGRGYPEDQNLISFLCHSATASLGLL